MVGLRQCHCVHVCQVICSEGNSGFYEVGCMVTPLDAGYSVLGWNHPGFWGSTVRLSHLTNILCTYFITSLLTVV